MAEKRNLDSIKEIVSLVKYDEPGWKINFHDKGEYIYLQVSCEEGTCNVTGEPLSWTGRKWLLSRYMTDTEIVRTAHKAIEAAVLHEMNEKFTFMGRTVCDPHIDIYDIVNLRDEKELDGRD